MLTLTLEDAKFGAVTLPPPRGANPADGEWKMLQFVDDDSGIRIRIPLSGLAVTGVIDALEGGSSPKVQPATMADMPKKPADNGGRRRRPS